MLISLNELAVIIENILVEAKAHGGREADYPNLSKKQAKRYYSTIQKDYGKKWEDQIEAFDWASDPAAALATLKKKATGKWSSRKGKRKQS